MLPPALASMPPFDTMLQHLPLDNRVASCNLMVDPVEPNSSGQRYAGKQRHADAYELRKTAYRSDQGTRLYLLPPASPLKPSDRHRLWDERAVTSSKLGIASSAYRCRLSACLFQMKIRSFICLPVIQEETHDDLALNLFADEDVPMGDAFTLELEPPTFHLGNEETYDMDIDEAQEDLHAGVCHANTHAHELECKFKQQAWHEEHDMQPLPRGTFPTDVRGQSSPRKRSAQWSKEEYRSAKRRKIIAANFNRSNVFQ